MKIDNRNKNKKIYESFCLLKKDGHMISIFFYLIFDLKLFIEQNKRDGILQNKNIKNCCLTKET